MIKKISTRVDSIQPKTRISITMDITGVDGYTPYVINMYPSHIAYCDVASGGIANNTVYFSITNNSVETAKNEDIIAIIGYVPDGII